jgi:hypothetical protein
MFASCFGEVMEQAACRVVGKQEQAKVKTLAKPSRNCFGAFKPHNGKTASNCTCNWLQ